MAIYIKKEEFKKYKNFLTIPMMTYREAVEKLNPDGIKDEEGWNGFECSCRTNPYGVADDEIEYTEYDSGRGFYTKIGSNQIGYIYHDEGGYSFVVADDKFLENYAKLGIVRK